jgi:hypothetical protein
VLLGQYPGLPGQELPAPVPVLALIQSVIAIVLLRRSASSGSSLKPGRMK